MEPDLKLVLTGDDGAPVEILAYQQVMINASPVFKAMLRRDAFTEGNILDRDKFLELSLPDDDPEMMTILCDMLHFRSERVPMKTISCDVMDKLAILIDKYDVVRAIQPWAEIWRVKSCVSSVMSYPEAMPKEKLVEAIRIAYNCGYADEFRMVVSCLLQHCSQDGCETGLSIKALACLPSVVHEEIVSRRAKAVEGLRQLCVDLVEELTRGKSCKAEHRPYPYAYTKDQSFDCSSVILGNAILALRECFGPQWSSEEVWRGSLHELYERMFDIGCRLNGPEQLRTDIHRKRKLPGSDGAANCQVSAHKNCARGEAFISQVKEIISVATAGLTLLEMGHAYYREQIAREHDN